MPAEPRTAAACILVRGDDDPEVLLARRNPALRFMGGHHVFPGGRIQDGESLNCLANAQDQDHARAILAAVREVFEETGLLCVRETLPSRELLQQARHRVLQGDLKAARLVIEEGATFIGKSEVTTGAISAKAAPRPEVVRSNEPIKAAAFGVRA